MLQCIKYLFTCIGITKITLIAKGNHKTSSNLLVYFPLTVPFKNTHTTNFVNSSDHVSTGYPWVKFARGDYAHRTRRHSVIYSLLSPASRLAQARWAHVPAFFPFELRTWSRPSHWLFERYFHLVPLHHSCAEIVRSYLRWACFVNVLAFMWGQSHTGLR